MSKKEVLFWILGLSVDAKEEENENETQNIDISETPKQRLFCNIQAIILMSFTGFFWAFFNRYN
jgi:hypothetical protein